MNKKIGLKDAMSIGIGGMVGGGIFAVLGLAVSLAKGGTPIAFLLAGILALVTSYSYVELKDQTSSGKLLFEGVYNIQVE
jgi:amino acid transporter